MIQETFEALKSDLQRIQQKRRQTARFQKITWSLAGVYLILLFAQYTGNFFRIDLSSSTTLVVVFVLLGVIQITGILFAKLFKKYRAEEAFVIGGMLKKFFPDFKFHPSHYLPQRELIRSKIFAWFDPENLANLQYTYGYLQGQAEGVPFHISDIGLAEPNAGTELKRALMRIPLLNILVILYEYALKNIFTSQSADNVYYTFRGLFCWADFNKEIKGYTVVLPNTLGISYGALAKSLQKLNFKRDELVSLEDPRFEKEFVVYSTDQIEARYILTSSFMEKIYELKRKFDRPIMLSFFKNKIYIAVHLPHGAFAFNPDSLSSPQAIEEIYNQINTARQIVSDLSLNRRIWEQPFL